MEDLNIKNEYLEKSLALNHIENFERFDAKRFLEDKILAVEKVLVDQHIKLEIRIVEDNTVYEDNDKQLSNKDKLITFVIDDSIAEYINIVNIIGKQVTVGNLENAKATIYGVNALNVVIDDIDILDTVIPNFNPRAKLNKTDYRLVKTNSFKSFDIEKFLTTYEMQLLTLYPQAPKVARAIILLTDVHQDSETYRHNIGKTISLKVELEDVRAIPLELVTGRLPFGRANIIGDFTATVVKNNHVLVMADQLQFHADDHTLTVGRTS